MSNVIDTDVLIVGAGWSGLMACKTSLQRGLRAVVVERRSELGGVWAFSHEPTIPTVMTTTESTSSRSVTEMSDFFMPDEVGNFLNHKDVLKYLRAYAERFKLEQHIRFDTTVHHVGRDAKSDTWKVKTSRGLVRARFVVIASGVHGVPNRDVHDTLFGGYTGELVHSIEVKGPRPDLEGKRVLIYGGGETASDVAELVVGSASSVVMSIPNGVHFFQKRRRKLPHIFDSIVPGYIGDALDKANSAMLIHIAPAPKGKPGMSWACRLTTGGSVFSHQGHGIKAWTRRSRFFHAFINKNASPVDMVRKGELIPKRSVVAVDGKTVRFDDGTSHDFDAVITCTGYKADIAYVDPALKPGVLHPYKMTFHPQHPTMAFVGLIRPVILSIPALAEAQALAIMKVWSGQHTLPPRERREADANDLADFWASYFRCTSRRIGPLVEPSTFLRDMAKTFQLIPSSKELWRRSPRLFFVLAFTPWHNCTFLTGDPSRDELVIHKRLKHSSRGWEFLPFVVLVVRVVGLDRFTTWYGERKYGLKTHARLHR